MHQSIKKATSHKTSGHEYRFMSACFAVKELILIQKNGNQGNDEPERE